MTQLPRRDDTHFPEAGRRATVGGVSIIEAVYSVLKQEGYLPRIGEGGRLHFRYFGQECALHSRTVGEQTIAELECQLPRPVPAPRAAQQFGERHPLARLGEKNGRAALYLTSLIGRQDAGSQAVLLLRLLDQYTVDLMFGEDDPILPTTVLEVTHVQPTPPVTALVETGESAAQPARPGVLELPPQRPAEATVDRPAADQLGSSAATVTATVPQAPASGPAPAGWQDFWELMNERYHPLALALARLGVPVPSDVQVDMLQGRQVKGTAIMLWEAEPQSVVICEPGQVVPEGYVGGTWLRHFTVDQVAASIQHNLRRVGLL